GRRLSPRSTGAVRRYPAAHAFRAREMALCETLVNNCDPRLVLRVPRIEIAPAQQANAHRPKILWPDDVGIDGIQTAASRACAFTAKLIVGIRSSFNRQTAD